MTKQAHKISKNGLSKMDSYFMDIWMKPILKIQSVLASRAPSSNTRNG